MAAVFGYGKATGVSYSVIPRAASVSAVPRSYHRCMALGKVL